MLILNFYRILNSMFNNKKLLEVKKQVVLTLHYSIKMKISIYFFQVNILMIKKLFQKVLTMNTNIK